MNWMQRRRLNRQHGPVIAGLFDKPAPAEGQVSDEGKVALAAVQAAKAETDALIAKSNATIDRARELVPERPEHVIAYLERVGVSKEIRDVVVHLLLMDAAYRLGQAAIRRDPNHVHGVLSNITGPDSLGIRVVQCDECGAAWTEEAEQVSA